MTFPSTVLPFIAWSLTSARSPGLTSAANISGTSTLIVTMSDRATTKSGRPVGAGLGQVAGVDVSLDDDAVEGGLDLGVAEQGLDAAGVLPGDLDGGGRGGDVGLGLVERGPALDQADLGRLDLGLDLLAGRLGRAELAPGLVEQAAGLRPLLEQLLDALVLGLPAGEVGLDPLDAGLRPPRASPRRPRRWPRPP